MQKNPQSGMSANGIVALKNKRRNILSRVIRLLPDNAPAHSFEVSVEKARACGFEILQHPLYSPYLAPSDILLFSEMKYPPRCRRINQRDDVINVESHFRRTFYKLFMNALSAV